MVEWDCDTLAAYVRFKSTKVAKTLSRPSRESCVTVDLDRKGEVVGIEIIGCREIQISKILSQAAVKADNIDYSKVRVVHTGALAATN